MKSLLFVFIFLLLTPQLFSQFYFFGRNKVQYEKFEWKVIRTEHFDIYFYGEMDEIAAIGARYAEDAYQEYKKEFAHIFTRRVPLIFYNTHHHFEQTNTTPGFIPEGVGGFFEFIKGRVVIPFSGSLDRFKHVIEHELVHVFMTTKLMKILSDHRLYSDRMPPLWFVEGLAEYLSSEWDSQADMVMRDAVINNYFPGLSQINSIYGSYLMYKAGESFLHFVRRNYGHAKVMQMVDDFWMYENFRELLVYVLGKELEEIDREWMTDLKRLYFPKVGGGISFQENSVRLINEGYAFTPVYYKKYNSERVYFIANIDGYTSLYFVEKDDEGKYGDRKLVIRGEKSKEFETFHVFEVKLDISERGIISFVSKSGPNDVIYFYSIEQDEIVLNFSKSYLLSISGPSFSADGNKLLFSASDQKGFRDIFELDLESGQERRLTNDYYYDIDPVYGADPDLVLFASDRSAGRNERATNLFELNSTNGNIRYITNMSWNCIQPFYNKLDSTLYFVGEKDSIRNLFYTKYPGGETSGIKRATRYISSIFNPFISKGELFYSGFENLTFSIYKTELDKSHNETDNINYTGIGEPWDEKFYLLTSERQVLNYEKEYTLDYAQSQISTDPVFGTRGGALFSLSDLFGDDNYFFLIYNTAQVQSDFLQSFNLALSRFSMGSRANHGYGIFNFSGRRYDIRDSDEYYYERSFGSYFIMQFPFSRFDRLEIDATIANSDKQVVSGIIERKALLVSNSIAYVFDNSLWYLTGPLDGTRYRFQIGYTTDVKYSNVNYYTLITDLRYYQRITLRSNIAFRLSLYFNEGKEARRYFMGGSWDLRGWPRWSIRGEKMWISSVEARIPVIDNIKIKFPFLDLSLYGIRAGVFCDVGGAWDDEYKESLGSIGAGLRFNLFNILVLRYDVGKKIQNRLTTFQEGLFYQFFFGYDF
ncbi:MAG: hypothetical protein HUU54_06215 [Ignavibacteriaceae bacterium]|nr:hypothetical protein [Ignavibacteriaceae bacterium]